MGFDVFISYSRKDYPFASKIADLLEINGVSCFLDKSGISGGDDFVNVICTAIQDSRLVLVLASTHAYESSYVPNEINYALSHKKRILPYIIDSSIPPDSFQFLLSTVHWINVQDVPAGDDLLRVINKRLREVNPKPVSLPIALVQKQATKKLFFTLSCCLIIALLGFFMIMGHHRHEKRISAQASLASCEEWAEESRQLLHEIDSLRLLSVPEFTFEEELLRIQQVLALYDRIESEQKKWKDTFYAPSFDFPVPIQRKLVQMSLDSTFRVWKKQSVDAFQFHKENGSEAEGWLAKEYARRGLSIQREDSVLLSIANSL